MGPISMCDFAPRLSLDYFDKRLHLKQLSLTTAESGCHVVVSRCRWHIVRSSAVPPPFLLLSMPLRYSWGSACKGAVYLGAMIKPVRTEAMGGLYSGPIHGSFDSRVWLLKAACRLLRFFKLLQVHVHSHVLFFSFFPSLFLSISISLSLAPSLLRNCHIVGHVGEGRTEKQTTLLLL